MSPAFERLEAYNQALNDYIKIMRATRDQNRLQVEKQ